MKRVFVIGVGMTKFEKPGGRAARGADHDDGREGWDYPDMARESGTKALADAGVDYTDIEQGYVSYCSGDSTSGQRALYELGMTGIPIVNVNNNCSTAQQVYDQCGLGPQDFQVIELHDCFSANELLLYEALGLCGEGEAPRLIDDNDTTNGGRWVVNPSGGLISKGHPLARPAWRNAAS